MKCSSLVLILACISLFSCSKDEDPDVNPVTPSEPALMKGVFLDSPVEGLIYRTETQEGITNAAGEFKFEEGEEVSFFVGAIKIGEAIGKDFLSPIDIAITPNASINSPEVKNIAAFLQSLDTDKNADDGIQISAEAVDALSVSEINFRNPIIQLLGELVMEINKSTLADLKVVLPEVAAQHLAQTLELDYEMSGLEAGPFFNIIENWEARDTNLHWVHEFDSQGRIASSKAYLKYPERLAFVHSYSNYNTHGYPQLYSSDRIKEDSSVSSTLYFYLSYSQNAKVETISYNASLDFSPSYKWKIEAYDSRMRVTEVLTESNGVLGSRQIFEYDDENNFEKRLLYDYGVDQPRNVEEVYYTNFGSVETKSSTWDGLRKEWKKFYRDDYTLEKKVYLNIEASGVETKIIDFTDENRFVYRNEKYYNDFLYELIEINDDGSGKRTVFNEEDGSYYIEYRDADYQIYKTEFYDANGILISTE